MTTNESFDTIFATELLEHLGDNTLDHGLSEIGRVLKLGGYLILSLPYNEDLKQDLVICPKCGAKFHSWGHMRAFNEQTIKKILESKALEIIKLKALAVGFMARHKFLKHARFFLKKFGFLQPFLQSSNIFVVVREKR